MGQVLLRLCPNVEILMGPSILLGNAAQILGARYVASQLSDPGVGLSDVDRAIYFLKFVVPGLVLLQWLIFEYQAIARVPSQAKPWQVTTVKQGDENPPLTIKMVRVAQNTFEQSIVTLGVNFALVLHLNSTNAAGLDFRIAIANMILYIGSRPFFANFYLAHPNLRYFPLMVGGFWVNAGLALYAILLQIGVQDSNLLWHGCTIGCPAFTLFCIILIVPSSSGKKSN